MNDAWYVASEGNQMGPYTGAQLQQFAKEGRIIAETLLWAEGMADWVSASQVQGLLPAVQRGPARAGAVRPVGNPVVRVAGAVTPTKSGLVQAAVAPTQAGLPYATPVAVASGPVASPYASPAASAPMQNPRGQGGGNYPYFPVAPVNFGVWLGLLGSGMLSFVAVILMTVSMSNQVQAGLEPSNAMKIVLFCVMGVGALLMLSSFVYQLLILARAWSCLRAAAPRATPGKAVGMLFIPFFNIYWTFIAYNCLATDWNHLVSRAANLRGAPRMSGGVFLAYCISSLIFPPAALILSFPVTSQMCGAINYMSTRIPPGHR